MSVKIAAGICTYSDSLGLARCLDSLQGGGVDSIVVHGPYLSYNELDLASSEMTREVCRAYRNTRLIDLEKPLPEIQRRQTYLDNANNYDFLLVIDSDEYIVEADWPKFRENLKDLFLGKHFYIYDIMFGGHPAQAGPRPRLFREPSKIKYYKKHYWWHLPNDRIAAGASDSCLWVDGIKIMQDSSFRNLDRENARTEYQQQLLQDESKFTISNRELTGRD